MDGRTANLWVICPSPKPWARLRLFCFPYAGGGLSAFSAWADSLPSSVEVRLVQLPGRVARLKETPFTRMMALVEAAAPVLILQLNPPFAFYVDSMGAISEFERVRHLRRKGVRQSASLFVSGAKAPHRFVKDDPIHTLPTRQFLEGLRRFRGAPQAAPESAELIELLRPVQHADFVVCETYTCRDETRLDCPLWIYVGTQGHVAPREDLEAWKEHTSAGASLHTFVGGHFFTSRPARSFCAPLRKTWHNLVRQL